MKPERWKVRSLRRFRDHEVLVYVYLGIGGVLSAIYFVAAVMQTRLLDFVFHSAAWAQQGMFLKVAGSIIMLSIMRAVLWLPQLFWQVVMGGASFMDWLTAANIVKELM